MHRIRASHAVTRLVLALGLVLSISTPVSAGGAAMTVVVTTSSPTEVTIGNAVAYPVTITNTGKNTVNSVFVHGRAPAGFEYLGAVPSSCSQTTDTCPLGQMPAGASRSVILYYRVTASVLPSTYDFHADVDTSEGQTDNSDGTSANTDNWSSIAMPTVVSYATQDFVAGHAIVGLNDLNLGGFSTGLGNLSSTNRHGTSVSLRTTTEVTVRDISKLQADNFAECAAALGAACFGEASQLRIGGGASIANGIQITMRFDYSDLPNGMTEKKIRIVHFFDDGGFEKVENQCIKGADGVPTNLPCLDGKPIRESDKDITVNMWWAHNGIGRGW